jgi:hypothetical protein
VPAQGKTKDMVIGTYNGDMQTAVMWGTASCSVVDTALGADVPSAVSIPI